MPAQPNIESYSNEDKKFRTIFILKEPLEFKRVIPFLAVSSHPSFTDPDEHIILPERNPGEEEVIGIMSDITLAETIREIIEADKGAKKPTKRNTIDQRLKILSIGSLTGSMKSW